MKEIINKHSYILSIISSFKEIFNTLSPIIGFRKKNKLKITYRNKNNKKQPKISHTY